MAGVAPAGETVEDMSSSGPYRLKKYYSQRASCCDFGPRQRYGRSLGIVAQALQQMGNREYNIQPMRILALDTSTAAGSAALAEDGCVTIARAGDGSRTHGERLPRELMALLDAAHVTLAEIDRFAVAIGPGSFTGLRVGIATIQGLALAKNALVVPVSTFDALRWRARNEPAPVAAWIDAHRGEVFASLFAPDGTVLQGPSSLSPEQTLDAWRPALAEWPRVRFTGDGAVRYQAVIRHVLGDHASIDTDT